MGTPGNTTHRDSVSYVYAASGDLAEVQVIWRNSDQRDTVRFIWDPLGRRDTLYYSNGIIARFEYDADGALRLLCSTGPDGTGSSGEFDFKSHVTIQDADGLPTRVNPATAPTSCVQGDPRPYFLDSLGYDHKHQMIYRHRNVTETWQYDASGNRQFYTRTSSPDRRDSILPGHNRLLFSGRYSAPIGYRKYFHNDNGARTAEQVCDGNGCVTLGGDTYAYDGLGRPTWANGLSCPYDPMGRMAYACQASGLQLGYDGDNVVRTGHDEWSLGWTFIGGPGLDDPLFAKRGSDNLTHVFVTDGEGRQFAVGKHDGDPANMGILGASASGATDQSTTFDPIRLPSPNLPRIAFFRNRWYDQYSGRWTQEDPIGMAGGVNLYQYAGNNPAVWTDPFGLRVCYKGTENEIIKLRTATENATDSDITLDKNNCVSKVESRGNPDFDTLRKGFQGLVDSKYTFGIRFSREFSHARGGEARIYERFSGLAYPAIVNGQCRQDQVPWVRTQAVGHELAHLYPRADGVSGMADDDAAVAAENVFNRSQGKPIRCAY